MSAQCKLESAASSAGALWEPVLRAAWAVKGGSCQRAGTGHSDIWDMKIK